MTPDCMTTAWFAYGSNLMLIWCTRELRPLTPGLLFNQTGQKTLTYQILLLTDSTKNDGDCQCILFWVVHSGLGSSRRRLHALVNSALVVGGEFLMMRFSWFCVFCFWVSNLTIVKRITDKILNNHHSHAVSYGQKGVESYETWLCEKRPIPGKSPSLHWRQFP